MSDEMEPCGEVKECARCKQVLPVEDFYWARKSENQRQPMCRACQRDYNLELKTMRCLPKVVQPSKLALPEPSRYSINNNDDTTSIISEIRDGCADIARGLCKKRVSTDLKEIKLQVEILEKVNKIIITNSMFINENIDLTTITDEQLLELAQRTKEVRRANET